MPRLNNAYNEKFRAAVRGFQIHTCRQDRCLVGFRGKRLKKCKYGFKFERCDSVHLDQFEVRYLYPRYHEEDLNVVPYSLPLLMLWQVTTLKRDVKISNQHVPGTYKCFKSIF